MAERLSPARLSAALCQAGFSLTGSAAAGSLGRAEDAAVRPARLIEGDSVGAVPVGTPSSCPEPLAFLDGIQRHRLVAYARTAPLILGEVAAAVRLRTGRSLRTVVMEREAIAVGRAEVLAAAAGALDGFLPLTIDPDEPLHPANDLDRARGLLDARRGALELALGDRFRESSDAWLVVDGALSESPRWAADGRMLSVSKSHATLPFAGRDLETYLHLPPGHRTNLFQPASRRVAPVYSWGLRLWPWEGKDLFHGLVRLEAAASEETSRRADEYSRWIIAERSPLSTPDARWDRLLYGIHDVETYLELTGDR